MAVIADWPHLKLCLQMRQRTQRSIWSMTVLKHPLSMLASLQSEVVLSTSSVLLLHKAPLLSMFLIRSSDSSQRSFNVKLEQCKFSYCKILVTEFYLSSVDFC